MNLSYRLHDFPRGWILESLGPQLRVRLHLHLRLRLRMRMRMRIRLRLRLRLGSVKKNVSQPNCSEGDHRIKHSC